MKRLLIICLLLLASCGSTNRNIIDLSVMSKTAVYAEVSNIVDEPDDYIDKTIKMKGTFDVFVRDDPDHEYYYCFIADAAGCCSQGIEFLCDEKPAFPEIGKPILVEGIGEVYEEDDMEFFRLKHAVMKVL
ncbi:MAG: hypothetical protein ACSW8B_00040 [bacterium]